MFDPLLRRLVGAARSRRRLAGGAWGIGQRDDTAFPWLAATMALLCYWTAAARVVDGFRAGADNHD